MNAIELLAFWYISSAVAFYLGAAISNLKSFKDASLISVIRGLVGCLFWLPLVMLTAYFGLKGLLKELK